MQRPAIHSAGGSIAIERLVKLALGTAKYSLLTLVAGCAVWSSLTGESQAQRPNGPARANAALAGKEGNSSREMRDVAIRNIPFDQLTPDAVQKIQSVVDHASYFRRMPTEVVDCDPEMFAFLVRHPEVIVNVWDVMGVTKVSLKRMGQYQLQGNDGAGTTCKLDLIFGNDSMHVYYSNGTYQGNLWGRELKGRCIVVLYNRPGKLPEGTPGIEASMDVFMKLDNIGADLVVKTLGPLVGKTADYNFTECAAFLSQVSQTAQYNPQGIQQIAKRLTKIDPQVRDQFVATSQSVALRSNRTVSVQQAKEQGLAQSSSDPIQAFQINRAKVAPPGEQIAAKPAAEPSKMMVPEVSTRRSNTGSTSPTSSGAAKTDERIDSPTMLILGSSKP